MTTDLHIIDTLDEINGLRSISLAEMESVQLMNRVDSKYLIPLSRLPWILRCLNDTYRVVEIDRRRICQYRTQYYDTPDLLLYREHLGDRLNRYKVRQRSYVESNLSFTEVKFKNNKGRTIKSRIRIQDDGERSGAADIYEESISFLRTVLPFDPLTLRAVLRVDYQRITLVNLSGTERVTLDLDLSFHKVSDCCTFSEVVIAEVKQDRSCPSAFMGLMKQERLREGSLSKYCTGIISLYPDVRHNRFKRKFKEFCKLNKKNNDHLPANTVPGYHSGIPMVR